jgi:hypothetical protein
MSRRELWAAQLQPVQGRRDLTVGVSVCDFVCISSYLFIVTQD